MDESLRVRAPELRRGHDWFNTDRPLALGELRGRVVLLDFWTYCCINCIHVLGDLKRLERKYGDRLVVIGVHSAKFPQERQADGLRQAILRHGIEHPVVSDPDRGIWDEYTVSAWPTLVLIDPAGYIAGEVSGEGHHDAIDQTIGQLLEEFSDRLDPRPLRFRREQPAGAGPLAFPGKVLVDPANGRLFIADSGHHRIVIAGRDGAVHAIAGSGAPGATDGPLATASFHNPQGMALLDGMLYVADSDNHRIRRIDLAAGRVDTVAGTGRQAMPVGVAGPARAVDLNSPHDLAALAVPATASGGQGTRRFLFIAMSGSHQIWALDLDHQSLQPFAGGGGEGIRDGARGEALFAQPSGLALNRRWLFVADSEASALRCIDLESDEVTTVVGEGLFVFGDTDGTWDDARLQHPLGVAAAGPVLYLADTYNHKVKAVDLERHTVETVAGDGTPGRADGRPGRLFEPGGLCAAGGETLLIADTGNHAIRVLDLARGELRTLALEPLGAPMPAAPPA